MQNTKETKPYVLIIDEINRGNISKIFGELITIIEEAKKLGEDNEMTVTLPYSQQQGFGVPKNLYIIGTMNTSDRSIASIDIALRRRFKFEKMMPNTELIKEEWKKILETLNSRICVLLDRDHQIGHSYFIVKNANKDLKDIFFDSVIPLLNEYFYGDWDKLQAILGEAKKTGSFIKKMDKPNFANGYKDCEDIDLYDFAKKDEVDFDDALVNAELQKKDEQPKTPQSDTTQGDETQGNAVNGTKEGVQA